MLGIGNIGGMEFLVILAIALIFFGPRRLPGIANALGKSLREFRKALNEVKSEIAQAESMVEVKEPEKRGEAAAPATTPRATLGTGPNGGAADSKEGEPSHADSRDSDVTQDGTG